MPAALPPVVAWLARRFRPGPLEPWQRDQYVVVLTVVLAHVAFDLTQPFFPLYVRELGVTDLADASFWSGIVVGLGPLGGAFMGPFWGALADRYGYKPMVIRAMLTIGVMQASMAFVPDVYWLVALRAIMGLFAGFTPMAMALAIALGPRERTAHAIGMVQAATFLPMAIGPTFGGLISDTFGLRANFVMTGLVLLIPSLLLYVMVEDVRPSTSMRRDDKTEGGRGATLGLLLLPGFAAALGVLFLTRFTDRMLPPILPLYLVELGTPSGQLATITGFVVAAGAVAAATSSMLYGRWARPKNTRTLLLVALGGGALFSVAIVAVGGWVEVAGLRILLGLLTGGATSLAYALGANLGPASRSGLTLSMLSSSGQFGSAIAPMLAGLIGQVSLASVFVANGAAYLVALVLAALPAGGATRQPAIDPASPAAGAAAIDDAGRPPQR